MRYVLFSLSFLFIISTTTSCIKSKAIKDVNEIDRLFIPAYFYTSIEQREKATKAIIVFQQNWNHFKRQYTDDLSSSEMAVATLRQMDWSILNASELLLKGRYNESLSELQYFRCEFSDWKRSLDINDIHDDLWLMEKSISDALSVATDPMLELYEWNELLTMSYYIGDILDQISLEDIDLKKHKLTSASDRINLKNRFTELSKAIEIYIKAVECGDANHFSAAAITMHKKCLATLLIFYESDYASSHFAAATNFPEFI